MVRYRYALTIAYDGSRLIGFQTQKDGETVQFRLESALALILREETKIQASGRTDSGVHATGQVISFRTQTQIDDPDSFMKSIDALAGPHIQALKFHEVPYDFHARFDCMAREYEYLLLPSRRHSLFLAPYVWQIPTSVDLDAFLPELLALQGEHNFEALTKKANPEEKKERYLDHIELRRKEDPVSKNGVVALTIRGNAFLHNMIRIIVGSFVDRAAGRLSMSLPEIVNSRDRRNAGRTAPPTGLYFRMAYYPEVPDLQGIGLHMLRDYPVIGNSLFKQKLIRLHASLP